MHVPKTAGTSLRHLLERFFSPERVVTSTREIKGRWGDQYPPLGHLLSRPAEAWRGVELLQGHYPWQIVEKLARPALCVTLLRDPVQRSLSAMAQTRRSSRGLRGVPLEKLLADERYVEAEIANLQTRMLAQRFALADPGGWPQSINSPMAIDEAVYERAAETLAGFSLVGLQERFEETAQRMISLLAAEIGLDPEQGRRPSDLLWKLRTGSERPWINRTPRSRRLPVVSAEVRERLEALNRWDRRLYAQAARAFDAGPAAAAADSSAARLSARTRSSGQ